ncbi:rho GTPase-activating 8 [Brachionus plicatilis]|uniref:Rho GTPase-activating 8 n=1 Tax=Brachionus plicatilis TaxID=10195 RepID=A0A3M7PTD8_BRAPC|nr:rho GTPase-activating 8 [Brachionus plicatilis]
MEINEEDVKIDKLTLDQNILESAIDKNDIPDLEYDEEISPLVADESKIGNSHLTSDNLIDEDYEAELGAHVSFSPSLIDAESEKKVNDLKERIDRYGIVNVCGTDLSGRPIIVLSAVNLPNADQISQEKEFFHSHQHFFDVLLEVLCGILENYVESEYTLVYFHYGLKSSSQPPFNWLTKVYKMLDRKFKKNLKALYVVHPSVLFKVLWQVIRPLISSKFNKKVTYCSTLAELGAHIDLNILKIHPEIRIHDASLKPRKSSVSIEQVQFGPFQQFKVSLQKIADENKGDPIPLCLKEGFIFLRKNIDEEGIFRKSGSYERIKEIQNLYNYGQPVAYHTYEYHVAASVIKAFVRELPESLLTDTIFSEMMSLQALDIVDKVEVARDLLNAKLPPLNYKVLNYLISFLNEVAQHSAKNKMDARNLSYVFGPNFLRTSNDPEFGLVNIEKINNFVELLIKYHSDIFSKD